MIITSFYETAYLLYKNYTIAQIDRDVKGKKLFHFIGERDLMIKDIEEFRNNKDLQDYIDSIVQLRNLNKECYKKWDNEKLGNLPSTQNKYKTGAM